MVWENAFATFLGVTLICGGGAAFQTGRSLAGSWRPIWLVLPAMLALAAVVRFFHFALFGGTLLSAHYYAVDALALIGIGLIGYRLRRVGQMVTQYPWLYQRAGLFGWRDNPKSF